MNPRTATPTHQWFRQAADWSLATAPQLGVHAQHAAPNLWMGHVLMQEAVKGGPPVNELSFHGKYALPAKQVVEQIENLFGVKPVYIIQECNYQNVLFGNNDTMISASFEGDKSGSVKLVTTDPKHTKTLIALKGALFRPEDAKDGYVYALGKGMNGYNLIRVGTAGEKLERSNYAPDVITDYDHVVQDLMGSSPCGRLTILAGTPGTGKTYLVRALLREVSEAAFVVVPSHLVQDLGSPDLLPALLTARQDGLKGPIVLIIEDADKVLVERKSGDMSAISALLNLGDGILGSALDIRIIATTNASELELDAATKRPGRLCRYIEIGTLEPEQASNVLLRLTDKTKTVSKPMTLAEVYQLARKLGWVPPPRELYNPATVGLALAAPLSSAKNMAREATLTWEEDSLAAIHEASEDKLAQQVLARSRARDTGR